MEYLFKITAETDIGVSPDSITVSVKASRPPDAPVNLYIDYQEVKKNSQRLQWTKGASDGDSTPVRYYIVHKKLSSGDEWEDLVPKVIADKTYTDFTLTDF